MDAAALRQRLAAPPPNVDPEPNPAGDPADKIAAPVQSDDARDLIDAALVPAAVLVPLVLGARPGVLLTRRTQKLRRHAGQVAFPGGRIDPTDADATAAALREAQEEIDLDPTDVEVIGRLSDYVTGTGYLVTPIVGLLPPGLAFHPAPEEVDAVFELPLSVLLDPEAPVRRRAHFRGSWREFWVWPHPEYYIWGATAAILVHLAQVLRVPD